MFGLYPCFTGTLSSPTARLCTECKGCEQVCSCSTSVLEVSVLQHLRRTLATESRAAPHLPRSLPSQRAELLLTSQGLSPLREQSCSSPPKVSPLSESRAAPHLPRSLPSQRAELLLTSQGLSPLREQSCSSPPKVSPLSERAELLLTSQGLYPLSERAELLLTSPPVAVQPM
ncbi:hypothetical protein CesoFtcFv8_016943 [Champsocephalus esox]|uniref:Uncharacterized protein n=1 Tax=Champsocephalus esox TaxID=159716 RepID=A0AAN8GNK2_9TELE|nr:hypothetical protein CesoFtcFv8_016943 [Champsocephalus esox]